MRIHRRAGEHATEHIPIQEDDPSERDQRRGEGKSPSAHQPFAQMRLGEGAKNHRATLVEEGSLAIVPLFDLLTARLQCRQ